MPSMPFIGNFGDDNSALREALIQAPKNFIDAFGAVQGIKNSKVELQLKKDALENEKKIADAQLKIHTREAAMKEVLPLAEIIGSHSDPSARKTATEQLQTHADTLDPTITPMIPQIVESFVQKQAQQQADQEERIKASLGYGTGSPVMSNPSQAPDLSQAWSMPSGLGGNTQPPPLLQRPQEEPVTSGAIRSDKTGRVFYPEWSKGRTSLTAEERKANAAATATGRIEAEKAAGVDRISLIKAQIDVADPKIKENRNLQSAYKDPDSVEAEQHYKALVSSNRANAIDSPDSKAAEDYALKNWLNIVKRKAGGLEENMSTSSSASDDILRRAGVLK